MAAVAGGGLTAAGLGGPLTSAALAETPEASTTTASPAPETPAPPTSTTGTETPATTTSTPAPTTPAPETTTTIPAPPPPTAESAPKEKVVLKRKRKRANRRTKANSRITETTGGKAAKPGKSGKKPTGPSNVAPPPQSVAQAGALAAVLASAQASDEALAFYRIPLFLLPIYKAAAVQYGVPWQILAAINEIETNYGTDLNVSSAGAVGWMQFMPETWLQYGVDALNAGYADPYNPVDAIFAAARYLRAAGAATDLHGAILAYNHSEEYVQSVLLRAKLISTYPKAVIATLTGLVDGRLPVTGKHVAWSAVHLGPAPSSATAHASPAPAPTPAAAATPGTTAVAPEAAAARLHPHATPAPPLQYVDLMSVPNARVVAVQDGRIVRLGHTEKLGKYVILRDVYGDLFTYAGLGSIAPTYRLPSAHASKHSRAIEVASTHDPAPSLPASAGSQSPVTLQVRKPTRHHKAPAAAQVASVPDEGPPAGMGRIRLFANPDNPDARAAAALDAARRARRNAAGQTVPLRKGSVVSSGTVLGRVQVPKGGKDGHIRFAIRPAGDPASIEPGPVLGNWAKLQTALHPQGATASEALLGATASDVLLLSRTQLERTVLADPDIALDSCARHDVASGAVDKRVLAVLAFLSRSGLRPSATLLRCGAHAGGAPASGENRGTAVDITAINGVQVADHQGPGTITDLTIRTLLTLPAEFIPHEILSLMRYPGAPNTHALPAYASEIHLAFRPPVAAAKASTVAHSAASGPTAPVPVVATSPLSAEQWTQLMTRVAALPMPTVSTKPSSQAIPDKPHAAQQHTPGH
jgi:membrane-bound lytic murein transglycosylase B